MVVSWTVAPRQLYAAHRNRCKLVDVLQISEGALLCSNASVSAREPVHRTHFFAGASPREAYDVVVDFAAYPRLFPDIKTTRVITAGPPVFRVEFGLQMVLPVRYVLDLTCDPQAPSVDW